MRNIALRLQYDGSAYHGWQVQKTEATVAETLEKALSKVMKHPVKVVGCGRTDAGVHALRYCANFRTDCTIPTQRVPLAVNARLPGDISVTDAVEAPEDFNAIGSCIQKEYIYRIHNSRVRDAFLERRACLMLFRAGKTSWMIRKKYKYLYVINGTSQNSVIIADPSDPKNIKIASEIELDMSNVWGEFSLPQLLETRDRRLTGPTMPPQGLYLNRVWYDGAVGEMMMK